MKISTSPGIRHRTLLSWWLCCVITLVGCTDRNTLGPEEIEPNPTAEDPTAEDPTAEDPTAEDKTAQDTTDEAEGGGAPPPGEDPKAGLSIGDSEGKVLWIREMAGYVPVELAEQYQRFPYRFCLYRDGRVVYRDDEFRAFEAQLTESEMLEFIDGLELHELADAAAKVEALQAGEILMDAGTEVLGFHTAAARAELSFTGSIKYWQLQRPDNATLAKCAQVRGALLAKQFPNAKPRQP